VAFGTQPDNRWELYKILGDRLRLRVLAAAAQEELAIGELAEALGESQPNVSRQVAPLRALGLLDDRRQGTRVLVRVPDALRRDPVVSDALTTGRALLDAEGVSERIANIVQRRDAAAREFFAQSEASMSSTAVAEELPAYLAALAVLLPRRGRAVDAGTGDGRLLDVLAPLFEQVVGVDREPARLARAEQRVAARAYRNVRLLAADLHDAADVGRVAELGLADVVIASRILHHAPRPAETVAHLASLLGPGGTLVVLDYLTHDDEGMREHQADLWLGFEPGELAAFARAAGLADVRTQPLPAAFHGTGPDRHLTWQLLSARR
jgi:DNA-binding transcriptional ArsR family regulator/protein-L-isoaspartate O-methyltransferase